MRENLMAIARAGADLIITYHCRDALREKVAVSAGFAAPGATSEGARPRAGGPAVTGTAAARISPETRTLFDRALDREPTPRRPLWINRQAGRYLPEYRKLRERYGFKELAGSAELAAEVTLQPIRRFPLDAAIIFADIMSPLPALGIEFDFAPGPVVAEPIRSAAAVDALPEADSKSVAPEVIEAIALVRRELPAHTALLGFCGAPWTLAAYLVEGRGVKDFPRLRAFAAEQPRALERLLERLSA